MKDERVTIGLPASASVVLALVSVAILGCTDSGSQSSESGALPGQVTYAEHVAPIMFEHCGVCHRKGEAGPFQLLTYRDTKRRAKQIVDITKAGIMPPWLPESAVEPYRDERGLSPAEINLLEAWVQQGALEGDPADLPPIPEWKEGWQLGEPDLVLELPEPFELTSQGLDVFHTYLIPVPITSTKYVATAEVRPQNRRVVHHALMLRNSGEQLRRLDAAFPGPGYPGTDLADAVWPEGHMPGWLPGRRPFSGREDIAWKLEPGDDVVLQLHMNPSGKPELVSPKIGLYWADEPPERQATLLTLKRGDIDIAPGEKHYKVEDDFVLPVDVEVLALQPHAHYLGTTMRGVASLPDGTEKLLLDIRQWDFNWQDRYEFVNPVFLPKGTVISILYEFDNSAENERNPSHPPERVLHGWNTKDEMAELWLQVIPKNAKDLRLLQKTSGEEATEDRLEEYLLSARIAVEQRPFDRELDKQISGAHAELGHLYSKQGRLGEAEEQLRNALRLQPELAKVQDELGSLLASQGQWLEAIPFYEEALREQPRLARVHVNLALAFEKSGQPVKAQRQYKRAIKIRPERADYLNKLGEFHLRQRERQKAIDSFQMALKLDPGLASAQKNLARARASAAKSK